MAAAHRPESGVPADGLLGCIPSARVPRSRIGSAAIGDGLILSYVDQQAEENGFSGFCRACKRVFMSPKPRLDLAYWAAAQRAESLRGLPSLTVSPVLNAVHRARLRERAAMRRDRHRSNGSFQGVVELEVGQRESIGAGFDDKAVELGQRA